MPRPTLSVGIEYGRVMPFDQGRRRDGLALASASCVFEFEDLGVHGG